MKWYLLLFLVVVVVYVPSAGNGFIYDDSEVILNHPGIASFGDLLQVFGERHFPNLPYYRPVTRSTLLLQKTVHGEEAGFFHVFNVLLVGVAAVLACVLLRLEVFGIGKWPAFAAAAIFALHPIASSCVYPVSSGRETLMPAVWTIASLYAYLRGWRAAAYLGFALALFSKEQAVVIPVLFLVADFLKLSADPPRGAARWIVHGVSLALLLGIYFAIRHALFGGQEWVFGPATGVFWAIGYAWQTVVVPYAELTYEPARQLWLSTPRLVIATAVVAVIVFLAVRLRPRARACFWAAWFLLTLLPTANILQQEVLFDERYVFLPSLALLALAAMVVPAESRWTAAAGLAGAAICIALSAGRAGAFKDDLAFSTQWLRTNPTSVNALYNMGFAQARRGEWQSAIPYYERALELQPALAYAHNNLGNALLQTGRREQALVHFQQALEINPGYADAHVNLGLALAGNGDTEAAIPHFLEALRTKPDLAQAHNSLGIALASQGRTEEALEHFRSALRKQPEAADIHNNLANALAAGARYQEAITHYQEALRLRPDYPEARRNLQIVRQYAGSP